MASKGLWSGRQPIVCGLASISKWSNVLADVPLVELGWQLKNLVIQVIIPDLFGMGRDVKI